MVDEEITKAEQVSDENRGANDLPDDRSEPNEIEPGQSREPTREEKTEETEKPKQVSKYQDKRSAIYAKAKANRDQADEDTNIDGLSDERERMVWGDKVETRADREARRREERGEVEETTTEPEERAVEAPESRMKLKVRGQDVELPQDEVIALAQKAAAAGDILEHAKQLRAEQMQILENLKAAGGKPTPAGDQASESAQTGDQAKQPDDTELDDIIDRIQVGSPEDAKQALAKYGENIVNRVMERIGNIDEHIEQTIRVNDENSQRQREMTETLTRFTKDNPEFAKSQSMQTALATEAMSTMRENMRSIGVQDSSIEGIKRERGLNDIQAVAYAYRWLRGQGHELPDNETVLRTSATRLREQFGIQKQEQRQEEPRVSEERIERKRNLGPQPRRANAAPTAEVKERSREEARRSAVRQMKAYRRGR